MTDIILDLIYKVDCFILFYVKDIFFHNPLIFWVVSTILLVAILYWFKVVSDLVFFDNVFSVLYVVFILGIVTERGYLYFLLYSVTVMFSCSLKVIDNASFDCFKKLLYLIIYYTIIILIINYALMFIIVEYDHIFWIRPIPEPIIYSRVYPQILVCILCLGGFLSLKNDLDCVIIPIYYMIILSAAIYIFEAGDLFTSYLVIELQSLTVYVLIGYRKYSNSSSDSSLKYFIIGSIGSGILSYGISSIHSLTGSLGFNDLGILFDNMIHTSTDVSYSILIGFLLILIGLFIKLGVVPFHYWILDVYSNIPISYLYFILTVPKISLIYFLFGVLTLLVKVTFQWPLMIEIVYTFLKVIGILSIFIGSVYALYQTSIKRMLVLSSVANTGFILLAFSLNTLVGFTGILFLFIIYIINLTLISILLYLVLNLYKDLELDNLSDFYTLVRVNKPLCAFLILSILSAAGIPPMSGFFPKLCICYALYANGNYILALYRLVMSIFMRFYYIRLVEYLWFHDMKEFRINQYYITKDIIVWVLCILIILNVFSIFLQVPLFSYLYYIVSFLYQ